MLKKYSMKEISENITYIENTLNMPAQLWLDEYTKEFKRVYKRKPTAKELLKYITGSFNEINNLKQ